jgi:hypothetical protein
MLQWLLPHQQMAGHGFRAAYWNEQVPEKPFDTV